MQINSNDENLGKVVNKAIVSESSQNYFKQRIFGEIKTAYCTPNPFESDIRQTKVTIDILRKGKVF